MTTKQAKHLLGLVDILGYSNIVTNGSDSEKAKFEETMYSLFGYFDKESFKAELLKLLKKLHIDEEILNVFGDEDFIVDNFSPFVLAFDYPCNSDTFFNMLNNTHRLKNLTKEKYYNHFLELFKKYNSPLHDIIENTFPVCKKVIGNTCFTRISKLNCTMYSDNLLLFVELTDENNLNNDLFYNMAYTMKNLQDWLLQNNILSCGAMTTGDFYYNKNYVFGEGLVKIHTMEKNEKFPRVCIDKKLISKYHTNKYIPANKIIPVDTLIKKAKDNTYFLNYLSSIPDHKDKKLIENIIKTSNEQKFNNDNVIAKQKWLIDYYNDTVKTEAEDLTIKYKTTDNYTILASEIEIV